MEGARTPLRRVLLDSLRGRRGDLARLVAWSMLEAIPAFLSGRLVAEALDEGFLAGDTETGLIWLGLLALAVIVGAWGTRQTFLRLANLVEPFRDELVERVVRGSLQRSTTDLRSSGGAGVARLTQQVEIAREAYASVLLVAQGFLVTTVSALAGLATLVPAALVLVVPPLLVGLALFVAALGGMAARQRASILADERIAEEADTLTGGLRDVVACGGEKRMAAAVGEHVEAQARATRELARYTAVRTVAVAIGGLAPLILILAGGSWLIDQGASTGAILGALTYVSQGVHPALQALVRGLGNTGLWLVVALRRIVEASAEPGPPAMPPGDPLPEGDRRSGLDLRLTGVTFSYGRGARPVLQGLDLDVEAGDHLAVAGPSGVGKSTLAGLIAGLLIPDHGDVSIGGVPVADLDAATLAGLRALIPQEAYVFTGSLWENISYLRPDVTADEVDRAADRLGMRALLERLGGYDAEMEPAALSAGERQLVTALRAYVSECPLVVLDEATCHLDAAAERVVEDAFAERPGTLIVIAHRISSAVRARRILVLDGASALTGSHPELLSSSPVYRDLVGHWKTGPEVSEQVRERPRETWVPDLPDIGGIFGPSPDGELRLPALARRTLGRRG